MNLSDIELPSNRKFGFFFAAVFAGLCAYFYWQAMGGYSAVFAVLAIAFFAVTVFRADLLLPLNKLWMRFGLLLGKIISPIVLGLIFFVLFMPIAVLMRRFGRDELRLKRTEAKTHWRSRGANQPSPESFKFQF